MPDQRRDGAVAARRHGPAAFLRAGIRAAVDRRNPARPGRNHAQSQCARTDAAGGYSFTTVRPGSYPGTRAPQHIHYEVAADGHGPRFFEIIFEDDPHVDDELRRRAAQPGSHYSLKRVGKGPAGESLVVQDVVLGPR